MSQSKLVWQSMDLAATKFTYRHPLVENAEVSLVPLSRLAGLMRAGVNLVEIPPGRQAFAHHRHHVEEEWVYVLSGTATVRLDDETHELAAGGFEAFMPGGAAHSISNASPTEPLVCLMGGESSPHEVVDFPDAGKRLTRSPAGTETGDLRSFEPFDFFSRTPLPKGTG